MQLSKLFQFVAAITSKYNIDESHGLGHSMRVFQFTEEIVKYEPFYIANPFVLEEHRPIIQTAAILHDTCDKKYREEADGLTEIRDFLLPMIPPSQITVILSIIETMSYSKIKARGMPDLGKYQTAFDVVREADLLDAYDFDRSMIYHMLRNGKTVDVAYKDAEDLFATRVFKHADDGYLTTKYALETHPRLTQSAMVRMNNWRRTLSILP